MLIGEQLGHVGTMAGMLLGFTLINRMLASETMCLSNEVHIMSVLVLPFSDLDLQLLCTSL